MVDVTHGICAHYQGTGMDSQNRIIWKRLEEIPLKSCNGNASVKPKDYLATDDWRIDVETNYTCKTKD